MTPPGEPETPQRSWGLAIGSFVIGAISFAVGGYGLTYGDLAFGRRKGSFSGLLAFFLVVIGALALYGAKRALFNPVAATPSSGAEAEDKSKGRLIEIGLLLGWAATVAYIVYASTR